MSRWVRLTSRFAIALVLLGIAVPIFGSSAGAQDAAAPDLAAVKQYATDQATAQKAATAPLVQIAQRYYDLAKGTGFDYEALWSSNTPEVVGLLAAAKQSWVEAHNHYELNEGLIAGVPSLSYYDVLIDAGPTATEDAAEALDWTLTLPNGETMVKPGNLFHSLAEPTIWGTNPDFVAAQKDLDGDGTEELGEVMPEANLFLAVAQELDTATGEMLDAVNAWEPTIEDAFTALVTMLPTMNEYFEQWKLSSFVAGNDSTEQEFVGNSRLIDVYGIVHGLQVTYQEISPAVDSTDSALHTEITTGFDDLVTFVSDLYDQESTGKQFTSEEADLYGGEAQEKATALAGQVSQAIALLGLQV